ncbi:acyltransferase [Bacillaceae bacterium W0354]
MKRERIVEIGYMRGLAMLAVVLIHITAITFSYFEPDSFSYKLYTFISRFFRYGTATFIFISGLVMFYGYFYKKINGPFLKRYFKNRLVYIFVPYLVWVAFYEIFKWSRGKPEIFAEGYWQELYYQVIQGNTYYHLYFFYVLIQLYLLFPLLLYLAQRFKWFRLTLPLLGLIVQLATYVTNYHYHWLPVSGSYFMSFFLYFCLGGLVGIYFESVISFFKKWHAYLLGVAMLFVGSLYVVGYYKIVTGTYPFEGITFEYLYFFYASLSALTLLVLTHFFIKGGPIWIRRGLDQLSLQSFGIFLMHPMVIHIIDDYFIWQGSRLFHVGIALRFVITLLICYSIVYLLKKYVPLARYVVGR